MADCSRIVIITGHPTSGLEYAERMLFSFGMAAATPSRPDSRSPVEITRHLCHAHGCTPLESVDEHGRLRILKVERGWHKLAAGLWQANAEFDFWGWSDPAALHLLPYWCNAKPELRVVLVYDDPETLFLRPCPATAHAAEQPCLPDDEWESAQAGWRAYNRALLNFYRTNRAHCLLLHGGRLESLWAQYEDVRQSPAAQRIVQQLARDTQMPPQEASHKSKGKARTQPDGTRVLARCLAAELVALWPALHKLNTALDTVAELPKLQPTTSERRHQLLQAWKQFRTWHRSNSALNPALLEENTLLQQGLHAAQEQLEIESAKTRLLHDQLAALKKTMGTSSATEAGQHGIARPETDKRIASKNPASLPANAGNGILPGLKQRLLARRHAKKLQSSALFDAKWYLARYPDIARRPRFAKNPALHYVLHGASEGRDPSPAFSTQAYLTRYPDVRRSGINPLLHFLCHGQAEGRLP